jgi:hypothetical protein
LRNPDFPLKSYFCPLRRPGARALRNGSVRESRIESFVRDLRSISDQCPGKLCDYYLERI